jgi:hypothetical protein
MLVREVLGLLATGWYCLKLAGNWLVLLAIGWYCLKLAGTVLEIFRALIFAIHYIILAPERKG